MREPCLEQVLDAQDDFDFFEGLGEKIRCAGGEGTLPGLLGDVGRENDDRQVVISADKRPHLFDDSTAIEAGHEPVGKDEIRLKVGEDRRCLSGVGDTDEVLEPGLGQDPFEQPHVSLFVIEDENLAGMDGLEFGHGGDRRIASGRFGVVANVASIRPCIVAKEPPKQRQRQRGKSVDWLAGM